MNCCPGDFGQDETTPSGTSTAPAPTAPSFWDSINPFSSSTPAAPAVPPTTPSGTSTDAAAAPDPDDQYSKYFTLGDLTVTSQPYPNLPLDAVSQANLKQLGVLLDAIQDNVGTFTIASAYRSPQNQASIQAGGAGAAAATMAVSHSLHSTGQAADITPTNGMSPTQFAQAIYNNPITNILCGQLVDKSEGGNETSLHLSTIVNTGTHQFLTCTPMYVGAGGQYFRMTANQIGTWLASTTNLLDTNVAVSEDQAIEDEGDDSGDSGTVIGIAAAVAILAGAGYYFYSRKKRA